MAKRGRPSAYKPEFDEQAKKLCRLGATNENIANFFGVSIASIEKWIAEKPEFSGALKEGRELADAEVAQRLYSRATGYSHKAVKIVADAKTGAEHIVPYTEHYPPDTTACIFWLKNRRPDLWRDKRELSVDETKRYVIAAENVSEDDWERKYADSLGATARTSESAH